jgi:protein TonB
VTPTAAAAAAPTVGVPVPVPDAEATVATGATQAQLAVLPGSEGAGLAGAESVAVVPEDIIPRPEDFVAYDSPPQPIALAKPEYPPIARQAGVEGRVFVQLLLDLDGDVMDARVAKSSGNAALDEAAVEAGKKCKFTPAKQRDKPVRVWVVFPFNFSLRNP